MSRLHYRKKTKLVRWDHKVCRKGFPLYIRVPKSARLPKCCRYRRKLRCRCRFTRR